MKNDLFAKWFPYWEWECFKNGMWESRRNEHQYINASYTLLNNSEQCEIAMLDVINLWPISSMHHLSKNWVNRRPWIGQAACCLYRGSSEEETRIAWNLHLSRDAQDLANKIADNVIAKWERLYG